MDQSKLLMNQDVFIDVENNEFSKWFVNIDENLNEIIKNSGKA